MGNTTFIISDDKTWVDQNYPKQIHLIGFKRKQKYEVPARKKAQTYYVPHRNTKNMLYFWEQVDFSFIFTNVAICSLFGNKLLSVLKIELKMRFQIT